MASSDPKKPRDFERASDREDFDADEDPLVELARIVSEDSGGFSGRMSGRAKVEPTAPIAPPAAPAPPVPSAPARLPAEDEFSADLEAELMQELETSFSTRPAPSFRPEPRVEARRAPLAPVPPEPVEEEPFEEPEPIEEPAPFMAGPAVEEPAEEAPVERDDPDDLLRSIEEQLSQFEQRVRSDRFLSPQEQAPAAEEEDDPVWSAENEPEAAPQPRSWQEEPRTVSPRPEYRFRGPAGAGWDRSAEPDSETSDFADRRGPSAPASAGAARASVFGRQLSAHEEPDDNRVDYAEEARRRIGEPPLRAAFSDTEAPAMSRGARDFAGLEAELSRELDSAYADPADDEERDASAELDDDLRIAKAAVIAPEHGMRPPPPRTAPAAPKRSRRGLATAAAIVIVVAVGAAGAVYLRSFDQAPSGPPPVIAAPEGPVKIEPAAGATEEGEETVGAAVYDRVAGQGSDAEENVVDGAEEPQELARIVTPPAEGGETIPPPAATEESPATATEGEAEFGPRRVPTYVVRADGTIVTTAEAGGAQQPPDLSGQQMASAQTEAMEPTPVETVVIDQPRVAGEPGIGAPSTEEEAPPAETAMEMPAEEDAAEAPPEEATELAELRPTEDPAAAEPPAAAAPPAPISVPPTATSGYLVQLSATGSPEEAQTTYARLQSRYPTILGSLAPDIQRADLGARGVFYRVRVGPWDERDQAIGVCEALKAAGADCYVTQ